MDADKYIRTWRNMRLRFYAAATVGFLMMIFNIAVVIRPRQPLLSLLAWFGAETLLTVILVAWIWWFSCPRCGRNFAFSWKRFGMRRCVSCSLSLGAAQEPSDHSN